MAGCNHVQDGAAVDITNGLDVDEATQPAVVRFRFGTDGFCTGTFVSDTTLVTAAHCIVKDGQTHSVKLDDGQESVTVIPHPKANGQGGNTDVGVVVFKSGTAVKFLPVAKRTPETGDEVTIVGYGKSDHTAQGGATGGKKRVGKNRLIDASAELVISGHTANVGENGVGTGLEAASSSGDSGGPMLITDELVGVASAGYASDGKKHSFYANLVVPETIEFLKSTVARGAKIPSLVADPLAAANRDLFIAIGEPHNAAVDTFTLFAGADANVATVVYCRSTQVSLCPEGSAGYTKATKDRELGGRLLFKGDVPTTIADGDVLSFVALDGQGKIISAKAVKFQAAAE